MAGVPKRLPSDVSRRALLAFAVLVGCTANDDIHPPSIGAITPDRAQPGSTVSITGNYFCAQPEADDGDDVDPLACVNTGAVSFGTVPATVGQYTDTMITVEVPDGMRGVVTVHVSVAGRTSDGASFTVE